MSEIRAIEEYVKGRFDDLWSFARSRNEMSCILFWKGSKGVSIAKVWKSISEEEKESFRSQLRGFLTKNIQKVNVNKIMIITGQCIKKGEFSNETCGLYK